MPKLSVHLPFTCVTCGAETRHRPIFHVGLPFCCAGCVAGGPCMCSYDSDPSEGHAVRHCLDVAELVRPYAHRSREVAVASGR